MFSFCLIHSINLTYSTDLFKGNNAVFVEMYKAQIKFPAIIVMYTYIANIYKCITYKYHQKLHSFNAVFGYILNNDIDFFCIADFFYWRFLLFSITSIETIIFVWQWLLMQYGIMIKQNCAIEKLSKHFVIYMFTYNLEIVIK